MAKSRSSMTHILKCAQCGKYTMKEKCTCGGEAVTSRPVRYAVDATTAKYRRMARKEELQKKGLL